MWPFQSKWWYDHRNSTHAFQGKSHLLPVSMQGIIAVQENILEYTYKHV